MDVIDKFETALELLSLEEILERNDLEPAEALFRLWQLGLVEFPDWLDEDELQSGEEED